MNQEIKRINNQLDLTLEALANNAQFQHARRVERLRLLEGPELLVENAGSRSFLEATEKWKTLTEQLGHVEMQEVALTKTKEKLLADLDKLIGNNYKLPEQGQKK